MKYYESDDGTRKGSHMPFNFLMISDLNKYSKAQDFVAIINEWMSHMPTGETANWVVSWRFKIFKFIFLKIFANDFFL